LPNETLSGGASELARHWSIDPDVVYLNHGSFGACPIPVLEAQRRLRDRMERQLVTFFVRDLEPLLDEARAALAAFVGADARDLAFVSNTTAGVNAVVRSLAFGPGDEILTTNHAYGACRNALEFVARQSGARVVVAEVPFPIAFPERVVEAVLARATPRTRLAMIDHVTSPTALVFPIERIVAALAARGIDTLIDGSHAPGMLALDVPAIGAAYYTGHCHKWLCAPKGAAFLWVRRDRQDRVHPTTISHGAASARTDRSRFHMSFDWPGTIDPTAWLCVPESIRFFGSIVPGGWDEVRRRNRAMALAARRTLCDALEIPLPAPDAMIGSIATVPIPDGAPGPTAGPLSIEPLQGALYERYRIEVPMWDWPASPKRILRVSAQLYNDASQYERLAAALRKILGE